MHKFNNQQLPLIIIISTFFPPIVGNLRLEQIIIYPLFLMSLFLIPFKKQTLLRYKPIGMLLNGLLFLIIFELLVTSLNPNYLSFKLLLSQLENYVQGFALIMILSIFMKYKSYRDSKRLLSTVFWLYIYLVSINSILALMEIFTSMDFFMHYYSISSDFENTVMYKSYSMGRFLGIYDMPAINGIVYSLALLLIGYLINEKKHAEIKEYFFVVLISIGGILSVSKIFILGGTLLFLLYMFKFLKKMINIKFIIVFIFSFFIIGGFIQQWKGLNYFLRLFNFSKNTADLYTAGRLGENSIVLPLINKTLENYPIFGYGLGSEHILDNAYIAYFVEGGFIALLVYIVIVISLLILGLKKYIFFKSNEGLLLFFIMLLIVGAGMGVPVLYLNRISTILFVFIFLILCTFKSQINDKLSLSRR